MKILDFDKWKSSSPENQGSVIPQILKKLSSWGFEGILHGGSSLSIWTGIGFKDIDIYVTKWGKIPESTKGVSDLHTDEPNSSKTITVTVDGIVVDFSNWNPNQPIWQWVEKKPEPRTCRNYHGFKLPPLGWCVSRIFPPKRQEKMEMLLQKGFVNKEFRGELIDEKSKEDFDKALNTISVESVKESLSPGIVKSTTYQWLCEFLERGYCNSKEIFFLDQSSEVKVVFDSEFLNRQKYKNHKIENRLVYKKGMIKEIHFYGNLDPDYFKKFTKNVWVHN